MATLIHLNGAPGVGKSTIAERYAAEHPGVLNCDIDRLRTFIGGWEDDFLTTGNLIQPVALAMIRAHLDAGHDVVLPQMLASAERWTVFREVATHAGHRYVHILLQAPPGQSGARFYARGEDDPLHMVIRTIVEGDGGRTTIDTQERVLADAAVARGAIVLDSSGGVDATYARLVAAVT